MNENCKWTNKELKLLCKEESLSCSGTKEQLCHRYIDHLNALRENQKTSDSSVPEKYLAGLSQKKRKRRIEEFKERKGSDYQEKDSYRSFETDFDSKGKRVKTTPSSYTQIFHDMFPNVNSLEEKSNITGIPLVILKKIYNKGMAAFRTGYF